MSIIKVTIGDEQFELQAGDRRSMNGMPTFVVLRKVKPDGVVVEQRYQGTASNLKRPEAK